jgi:hypothetical protein
MDPIDPDTEPGHAPDPLDKVPDSIPAQLVPIDNNSDVTVADLTVVSCVFTVPPTTTDPVLELPDNIDLDALRTHRFTFAGVTAVIRNIGPGDASEFDVHFTVGIADWNEQTAQFEFVNQPVVRRHTVPNLRSRWSTELSAHLFPAERQAARLYIAVVEVNPTTPEFPLGKVVESDYTNNRCGWTYFDYPDWEKPAEPVDITFEAKPGEERWRVPQRFGS